MEIQTGIFLRGILVGTKLTKNRYTDKSGAAQENSYTEIGIEVSFINGFNQEQKMIKTARVSSDKEKDAMFIQTLSENHGALVELPVNVGDYRNVYVDSKAVLLVIEPAEQQKAG
ncbi:hypothetical protein [Colwellia psychrerythraea]|uniref:DUF961 domain-containing protein n=1 Tax=Colwellia psychrerythraea TaxID=28229 RepID=A0A099K983_COLPS|nr:hypothetical protein [Colwellia psychrerythraea]KGJ86860.1 hypothetical protein GAB14E_4687 [Colwellia psychrerythraea]